MTVSVCFLLQLSPASITQRLFQVGGYMMLRLPVAIMPTIPSGRNK